MMITQTTRIMSAYNAMCKRGRKINESVDELYDEDTEPIDTDTEDVDIESLISDEDDEDTADIEDIEDIEDVDSLEDGDDKEVPFEDEISESAKKCCGKKRCCNGKKGKKHCQCHSAYDTLGGQEVCESDMPVREKFDMISDEIFQKMDTTELDGHDVVTKLLECLKQISDMELEKVVDCIETTVLGKAEQEDVDAMGDDEIPEIA